MLKEGMFLQGRYEIVGKIGTGGMADVYKAKDHKLNRFVAVKVLKAEFREDREFITKFRAEAQAAAGLAHPNIVNIYDVGDEQGTHFIVMELVEGITLKDYITKKGRLAVREATSIAIQISQGLEAAHNSGIVHRDVKPQNVIISTDGKVKVTDFGIARAASSNTISTTVMGSVHYASPEQARGGYSDAKSDIYSLGITLYEMLTGHVPFDGDTTVAIAIKHLQEEMTAPEVYVPDLPKSTIQIINKCTQKSPDRRYQNMTELIRDLKESLINPDGVFVRTSNAATIGKTIVISKEEMSAIKEGYNTANRANMENVQQIPQPDNVIYMNNGNYNSYPNRENYDPYAYGIDSRAYGNRGYNYQEDPFDKNRVYQEDDDDDDGGMLSPKLEKIMTIGSIIIAILIAVIFLGLVANALGIFKFSLPGVGQAISQKKDEITEKIIDTATGNSSDSGTTAGDDGSVSDNGTVEDPQASGVTDETQADEVVNIEEDTEETTEAPVLAVPYVIGLDYLSAVDQIMAAGYYVSRQDESSDQYPEGTVMDQSVTGEASPGTTVILIVSTGAAQSSNLWTCNAQLVTPENYNGELVRMVLEHGSTTTTLVDGSSVTFPYDLYYQDSQDAATGTVYLYVYDETTGTYELGYTYDNVPFTQG